MNACSIALFILSVFSSASAYSACISLSSGGPAQGLNDFISKILTRAPHCPEDVLEFRKLILSSGAKLDTTMVANRGFHNPSQGSFSFFEIVSSHKPQMRVNEGDVFIGHFTGINSLNQIDLEQTPSRGNLMIEAFAWDKTKGYYNFYELIGDGKQGRWFYRGDSADIIADLKFLHLQPDPKNPVFGNRLRCSGCHKEGGPILKELEEPHNDWWTQNRKLDFGGRSFSERAGEIAGSLTSPEVLRRSVKLGAQKLESSKSIIAIKESLSLPEQLRPLFAPVEIDLESDQTPSSEGKNILVPSGFFIDPMLAPQIPKMIVAREHYELGLKQLKFKFPETELKDGDHAWLTPVKAYSDRLAIEALIVRGIIDRNFVTSVLSIDFTNPLFSEKRLELLKLLPQRAAAGWQAEYVKSLLAAGSPHALELAKLLTQSGRSLKEVNSRVIEFSSRCAALLGDPGHVKKYMRLLAQRRQEVFDSEISKNPRGQILEPGFRVIFPETTPKTPSRGLQIGENGKVGPIKAQPGK